MSRRDEPLFPPDPSGWTDGAPDDPVEALPGAALLGRLARPDRPGLALSDATADLLERVIPPEPVSDALSARLRTQADRAALDLEFRALGREPSLGSYLAFLRGRSMGAAKVAARKAGIDSGQLAELEADRCPVTRLPVRALALFVRRLHGSLEMTERLLVQALRADRLASRRASLYRRPRGGEAPPVRVPLPGEWERPPDDPQAQAMLDALREAWTSEA